MTIKGHYGGFLYWMVLNSKKRLVHDAGEGLAVSESLPRSIYITPRLKPSLSHSVVTTPI